MREAITRIAMRTAIFSMFGSVGTYLLKGSAFDIGQVLVTISIFIMLNVVFDVVKPMVKR